MLNKSNKLTGPFLIHLKNKFKDIAGEDQLIDKAEFFEGLEIKNKQLSDRLFEIFDKDKNGTVDYDEFISTIEEITNGSKDKKIRFAFKLHDLDNSGFIDKEELSILISQSFVENNLDYDEFQLSLLVDEFFLKADKDKSGTIDFDEFLNIATDSPDFIDGFAVNPIRWLASDSGLQLSSHKNNNLKDTNIKKFQVQEIGLLQSLLIPKMISYYNILLNRRKNQSRVILASARLLPSKTLEIIVNLSNKFEFIPGDYLYLNCSDISTLEWHPFNMIRQTKNNDIVLHIKSYDAWTEKLYEIVIGSFKEKNKLDLDLRVDGPYGSSSENISKAEHAILVGVGHGISKMAPILQDIALKIKNNPEAVKLKKVDLFWLIENQTYFEWFTKFLHEIQNEEKLNIFNYNIFFIDKSPHQVNEKMMYMSTDLQKNKTDLTLIDNIWGKSKFGHPKWDEELDQIVNKNNLQSKLFYSGPINHGKIIKKVALKKKIEFYQKSF